MNEISAVICETNPCHNGHIALFQKARAITGKDNVLAAVMSGNFVQRGLPAVWDKYRRAAMLLRQGVDLVVELPYPWSSSGGETFASGGVSIACSLGAARLIFGSEIGDTQVLCAAADAFSAKEIEKKRAAYMALHPEWGAAVLHDRLCADAGMAPLSANDKLALWYIEALRDTDCQPVAIPRLPYSDTIVSASRIREWLYAGDTLSPQKYVPDDVYAAIRAFPVTACKRYFALLHAYFRFASPKDPPPLREASGGLYERLRKTAYETTDGTSFFHAAACKKYTNSRLRRSALFCATGVTDALLAENPQYTILLAANEKGCAWLRAHRKNFGLPVLTKPADSDSLSERAKTQVSYLHRADDFYAYLMPEPEDGGFFVRKAPVIEK